MIKTYYNVIQLCYVASIILIVTSFFLFSSSIEQVRNLRQNNNNGSNDILKVKHIKKKHIVVVVDHQKSNNNGTNHSLTTTTTTTTTIKPIQKLYLNKKDIRLFHIGKSGGGTIRSRAKVLWKLIIPICHPLPCTPFFSRTNRQNKNNNNVSTDMSLSSSSLSSLSSSSSQPTQHKTVIITIRDPVDRFVSAFYWGVRLACKVNDTRIINARKAISYPNTYCLPYDKKQNEILLNTYQQNVSLLAESICNNQNNTIRKNAREHYLYIDHLRHRLHGGRGWLNFNWIQYSNYIYPTILENGYNFNKQIDNSILWLHNITNFENVTNFNNRINYYNNNIQNQKEYQTKNKIIKTEQHTSKVSTTTFVRPPLTVTGESCLIKFYTGDYNILHQIRDYACKSNDCINAIQSILNRRGHGHGHQQNAT